MDSSVSSKEKIWFLRVCLHISTGIYHPWSGFKWNGTACRYDRQSFALCLVEQKRKSCSKLQLWKRIWKWRAPVILNLYIMSRLVLRYTCGPLWPPAKEFLYPLIHGLFGLLSHSWHFERDNKICLYRDSNCVNKPHAN